MKHIIALLVAVALVPAGVAAASPTGTITVGWLWECLTTSSAWSNATPGGGLPTHWLPACGAQARGDQAQRLDAAVDLGAPGSVALLHRSEQLAHRT
jgi:hypothetical protein